MPGLFNDFCHYHACKTMKVLKALGAAGEINKLKKTGFGCKYEDDTDEWIDEEKCTDIIIEQLHLNL